MKETDVTIISTNLNKLISNNYVGYEIIENDFTYQELLSKKKVIFFNVLNNLSEEELIKLFKFLKDSNIKYINLTNNLELTLYTKYLIVYDKEKVLIEGNTIDVLKKDKLLKRLGFELPFIVELSLLLKDYNLIQDIYLTKESLARALWK